MKKALMMGLMLLIGIAFVTSVFAQSATEKATKAATDTAQEKAKAAGDAMKEKATKAATEKAAPAPEKAPAPAPAPTKAAAPAPEKKMTKAKVHQHTGEVTAMDMAAKTLTVKGKKGDMTFDVTDVKMKGEPKAGDKVMVKYTEKDGKMVAKSVVISAANKAGKKEMKPAAKPMAPEKPAAPAPAK